MFNKIVTSIISSVVLFACNVKEEAPVAGDVVVASEVSATEQPKVDPVVPPSVTTPAPAAPIVTDPLAVPAAPVTAPVSSPVIAAPTAVAPVAPVNAPSASPAAASTGTPAK